MRILLLGLAVACIVVAEEPVAVFGTTVVIPSGLRGDIYYLPDNTQTLERLSHLRPQAAFTPLRSTFPHKASWPDFQGLPTASNGSQSIIRENSGLKTQGSIVSVWLRTTAQCCISMAS